MKVLVLDLVHGGKTVAEKFAANGDDVTAVDVQQIVGKDVTGSLTRRGIRVLKTIPAEDFDVCARPCCGPDPAPANCAEVIDFSGAVNRLFDPYDRRFRIEVTGGLGKTMLCFVLAHILDTAGKRVYLHSSHGMGPYHNSKHIITDYQSTSVQSLLELPRTEYEAVVCEVAAGGSGRADISVIACSVEGKEECLKGVLSSGTNIVREDERSVWERFGETVRSAGRRVSVIGDAVPDEPLRVSVNYRGTTEIVLDEGYLALQYLDAFNMALAVCDAMDIPEEDVISGLSSFPGAPGRGETDSEDGVFTVKDHNSGVSLSSIRNTIGILRKMGISDGIVLDVSDLSDGGHSDLSPEGLLDLAKGCGATVLDGPVPEGTAAVLRAVKEPFH